MSIEDKFTGLTNAVNNLTEAINNINKQASLWRGVGKDDKGDVIPAEAPTTTDTPKSAPEEEPKKEATKVVKKSAKKKATPKAEPEATQETPPADEEKKEVKAPTFSDARAAIMKIINSPAHGPAAAKEYIVREGGADTLVKVSESKYAALIDGVNKLLEGAK